MYLAIDIGGTKTLLAVFDLDGKVVFKHKAPTNSDYKRFLDDLRQILVNELKEYEFSACACAAPGLIDHASGTVRQFGNLDWQDVPLKQDLQRLLPHAHVSIDNDSKLAALSEAKLVQNKYKKVLFITIGTGISAGIIINGKIDQALIDAEPGQMVIEHDGILQKWEDFASGKALVKRYGQTAGALDDPAAWQSYAKALAPGIDQLLAVVQPDVVIIGGGVGSHYEKFAEPLRAELDKLANKMVKVPPLIKAQRPEEAVIYGCYELIKQN